MRSMIQPGRLRAVILALTLVFATIPASASQIQDFDPDFYASELTGFEIEASGPIYEITEAELQHYQTGEGEIVRLSSESAVANLEVSFFDDADSPQESLDIYLQSMENAADEAEVIDRGVNGDVHYALALIEFDGVDIVYYLEVQEDVQGNVDMMQAILTSTFTLEADLQDAQTEVTIDGVPFMDTIDAAQLAEVSTGTGTLGESEEASPVASVDSFTFADSEITVGIGPEFSFLGESEQRTDVEAVRIQGPNTLSMIAVGQTGLSPEVVLNSFSGGIESTYAEVELVDEEINDDHAWRLLSIPKNVDESTFMLIIVDTAISPGYEVMHAHEVPADGVAGSLTLIQGQVTLNDAPLMPEIDPEEIADIAGDVPSGQSTQTSETPEATEQPTEQADTGRTGDPRQDARLPGPGDDDDDEDVGNTSETTGTVEATVEPTADLPADDADVPGELTDSSWEGEVHGHLIEWDASLWHVDTEFEGDLVSDQELQEDTIVLQTETADGTSWLYISVYSGGNDTPQDYLNHWVSDEYLATFAESGAVAEVVETRTRGGNSAVMLRITAESGNEYLVVRQAVTLESGAILVVTLDTPAADMGELYESAQAITIDGESVLQVYSPSQIQRTIGD